MFFSSDSCAVKPKPKPRPKPKNKYTNADVFVYTPGPFLEISRAALSSQDSAPTITTGRPTGAKQKKTDLNEIVSRPFLLRSFLVTHQL
jgi:hypothetical protein